VRQTEIDTGDREGITSEAKERVRQLERENACAKASERDPIRGIDFLRDRARRSTRSETKQVVAFIDANRDKWRVQPICTVPHFASSTYYDYKRREPSNRTLRDEKLKVLITETYEANYSVYGAKKLWAALNRAGNEVARCTVERLMRELGIKGAIRGKGIVITTIADESLERPMDLLTKWDTSLCLAMRPVS